MLASHLKATAFAAACFLLIIQANSYTMQNMCEQWSGVGYIGNPADCTGWGYCKAQQLASWGNCPKGQVFDPQAGICQYNYNAPCTTSAAATCAAVKSTTFVADPNDCTKYVYCWGNGTSTQQSCPSGQKYAANNNTCVWGPTCPQDTICRFMPSNIYVGDPNNCGQYLQCIKGSGVWGQCNTDKFYNAATGICQSTNPCIDDDTDTGNTNPNLPPATTDCTAEGFVGDSLTCYGFYNCPGKGTKNGKWGSCPFGLEFDVKSQKCVSPASLACSGDRCANTNLTYAAVAGTNCQEYTYCPNGQTNYCNPSFPYYDEINMKCVADELTYPICTGVV